MGAILKFLKDDTQAGDVYLKKIENKKYSERFKKSITRAESSWSSFGKACSDYVNACEIGEKATIQVLYHFLSKAFDTAGLPANQIESRMRALEKEIEENINKEEVE